MTTTDIPTAYEERLHCITVNCKIPLTREFARQRIAALWDAKSPEAVWFEQLYGEPHQAQVVEWYRRMAG
ncbi:MAG: hypothetical protein ACFCD0_26680 [Gemmataceae bacterium]